MRELRRRGPGAFHPSPPCRPSGCDLPGVATVRVEVPTSGEILQLQLRRDERGVIADARFKAYGCGWLIACGSLLTERIIGLTLAESRTVTASRVGRAAGRAAGETALRGAGGNGAAGGAKLPHPHPSPAGESV